MEKFRIYNGKKILLSINNWNVQVACSSRLKMFPNKLVDTNAFIDCCNWTHSINSLKLFSIDCSGLSFSTLWISTHFLNVMFWLYSYFLVIPIQLICSARGNRTTKYLLLQSTQLSSRRKLLHSNCNYKWKIIAQRQNESYRKAIHLYSILGDWFWWVPVTLFV